MDRGYNSAYSYDDISLWMHDTWADKKCEAAPIFERLAKEIEEHTFLDHYNDREDETRDTLNHEAYFKDVVDEWKSKGMYFSSYGMMGIVMAPKVISKRELHDASILFIPYLTSNLKHQAMNLLYENKDVLERAVGENILVQFVDCRMALTGAMTEKIIETQGTFGISCDKIFLDVSLLKDVDGTLEFLGRKVIDVTDKLLSASAHQYDISNIYKKVVPEWDFDKHIKSLAGQRQAESMKLERDYLGPHDGKMKGFFENKGIRYEDHYLDNEWYVTLTPKNAYSMDTKKLPLLIVMKEPRTAIEFSLQTAFQFYYDFIEICARGEYAMLFFALETPEDNAKYLPKVLKETLENNSFIDESRVYLTGQSHNGYYAQEYYRTHPLEIAACASLCDPVGLELGARADYYLTRADEIIEDFRKYDMPLININGNLENNYPKKNREEKLKIQDITCFENRMRAIKHTPFSKEEIEGAINSGDYATRMNGVPSDRTEVRYMMGSEVYISDYKNEDGKWYFRYASIENVPHMIMPQMAELSWEFMRRFARNTKTGEIIELY